MGCCASKKAAEVLEEAEKEQVEEEKEKDKEKKEQVKEGFEDGKTCDDAEEFLKGLKGVKAISGDPATLAVPTLNKGVYMAYDVTGAVLDPAAPVPWGGYDIAWSGSPKEIAPRPL